MSKFISGLLSVGVLAYVGYRWIPDYYEFDSNAFQIGVEEYYVIDYYSEADSPVKVEVIERSGGQLFDAYLLDGSQYQIIADWMATDDMTQPQFTALARWESVSQIEQAGINIPAGEFHLLIDNTVLGLAPGSAAALDIQFTIFEKL